MPASKRLFFLAACWIGAIAVAQEEPKKTEPPGEELEINKIKESYWSRGEDQQVGVVQDRLHVKRHKVELGAITGVDIGDPFLNTLLYGVRVGFHFSETYSLHAVAWFTSVSNSQAFDSLIRDTGTTANTNPPRHYLGIEGRDSFLYGKLSLFGSAILHFDTYFAIGAGSLSTESGSDLAFSVGVGQQWYLSQAIALHLDYRFTGYRETLLEQQPGKSVAVGQPLTDRTNLSHLILLGLSVHFDPLG